MKYSSDGRKCGERGKRKSNNKPITGTVLDELRARNIKEEADEMLICITCGVEIEHNYGTENYPQCIICGNENCDDLFMI